MFRPCGVRPPSAPRSGPGQMERWTAWVIRLTTHAASQATDAEHPRAARRAPPRTPSRCARPRRPPRAGRLDAGQVAIVRSVYALWDANHDRTERLAAAVDPSGTGGGACAPPEPGPPSRPPSSRRSAPSADPSPGEAKQSGQSSNDVCRRHGHASSFTTTRHHPGRHRGHPRLRRCVRGSRRRGPELGEPELTCPDVSEGEVEDPGLRVAGAGGRRRAPGQGITPRAPVAGRTAPTRGAGRLGQVELERAHEPSEVARPSRPPRHRGS